ncbi:hypothetical protein AXG93_3802s1090 [Marchantia polymorpha subsp. ruderalis]|uniref:Uncharacterized protein n=1 Tax=Marchantia polymorpha subsp. ruderalis TaxID=1480154 RepID=A0A176VK99_MARPO|nr:hypothetical protein AXG93_3802s1090 [Marchantia polymorpha subsp. ruderalis]
MQTIPPNVSRPWRWRGTQGEQRPTTPDEERWEEGAAVVGGKGGNGEHGEGKRAERVQEECAGAQKRTGKVSTFSPQFSQEKGLHLTLEGLAVPAEAISPLMWNRL